MKTVTNDGFDRNWITEQAVEVCSRYEPGLLTLRGLHYQLVALGMTNTIQHYKRVVSAMIKARRDGVVEYAQFSDHDREVIGDTQADPTDVDVAIGEGKSQIEAWMRAYSKNRWENQERYLEVWIEKKALQGVFGSVCQRNSVAMCPCKGYPSLTFLHDASHRFIDAENRGQRPTIVYFGDHDPSGEDIPRSIGENFRADFNVDVEVTVIALLEEQCLEMELPPAPAKPSDSRSAKFTGLGQIELDAVRPEILQGWAQDAIDRNFDESLHQELMQQEESERVKYQDELREFVSSL